jgi:prepilin-type N-terminal cleavage/methylation domain-containing protein/prepilin-type processing-associated H-X9-DG protein
MQRGKAFTLVELLVVVGIVSLLIAIFMPALTRARTAARQIRAAAGLRELLAGYTAYHIDHRGALPFGYPPPTVNGVTLEVTAPSGHVFGSPIAERYPWRLVPYVKDVWSILHNHDACPPAPAATDSATEAFDKTYMLSLNPSFGINAVFLGGQYGPLFRGFVGPSMDRPNVGKHVAFRASEIRRPTQQIVFTESISKNYPFVEPDTGLHYVTPPRAGGLRWTVTNGRIDVLTSVVIGVPQGRYGRSTIVGFFDGHVELLAPADLLDMRLWAPRATGPDYDF